MSAKGVNIYSLLCGFIAVSLAAFVMFGWHSGNQILVQVSPAFAPMQYNTALGFLLSGLGLMALSCRQHILTKLLGLGTFALGAASLSQYIFNVDFGIDELLMDPVFIAKTSHPGRMAPNTALCFMLFGFALSMTGVKRALVVSISCAVLVLAFLSFVGYMMPDHEGLYGWGNLTRMAIHTASGFLIVGGGLAVYSLWGWGKEQFDFWHIAPFSISMIVAVLTLFAWYMIDEEAQARNYSYMETLVDDTQDVLLERYHLYEEALRGGLGLYYASKSVERGEWKNYVGALHTEEKLPGISGIGYIDYVLAGDMEAYLERTRADDAPDFKNHPDTFYPDKFIIKFIEPVHNNIEAVGLDIGFEANRRAAAERARDLGVPALTKKILLVQDHKKQAGFLLLLPVYATNNTPETLDARREAFLGWVYAPFIGPNFFKDVGRINKNQLYLEVYDGKKKTKEALIYSSPHETYHTGHHEKIVLTQIKIAGRTWTLEWRPNENFDPPANENLGIYMLIFGLGFAVFLYFTLGRLLHSKDIIRQQVEQKTRELQESEGRYKSVLFDISDAIILINGQAHIIDFNPAAERMFGYEKAEVLSQNVKILMPAPYHDEHDGYITRYIETRKPHIIGGRREAEGIRKDGTIFPIELSVSEIEIDNGKLFTGIIRDITKEKEAEEQILTANEELQRSNHELERFAYIASHDLQEPLRKIGGFTERLEQHFAGQLEGDEKARQYMSFITGGVARMRELIMGLLAYSRVTTSDIENQKLDSNDIVAAALESLSETITENEAQILYKDLPEVYHDEVMLTQIFQNLISNAIKYRSEAAPEIHIKAKKTDGFWEFSVQDNGMGMEEKYLERIFEMFQRLHRKEDISGTGIGLSLCQKIVERYGGTIWVTSKPGEGSTFFFTVPAKT